MKSNVAFCLLLLVAFPAAAVQPSQVERSPGAAPSSAAAEQVTCSLQAAPLGGALQKVCLTSGQRAASAANAERVAADRKVRAARDANVICQGNACTERR